MRDAGVSPHAPGAAIQVPRVSPEGGGSGCWRGAWVLRVTGSVRSNEHRHYLIGNDGEERPQQPEEYVGKRIAVHIFDPRNYLLAEDRSHAGCRLSLKPGLRALPD